MGGKELILVKRIDSTSAVLNSRQQQHLQEAVLNSIFVSPESHSLTPLHAGEGIFKEDAGTGQGRAKGGWLEQGGSLGLRDTGNAGAWARLGGFLRPAWC